MKNTYIVAILLGLFGVLYEKTNIVLFDYASIISGIILVVMSIHNITMLVDNKVETNHKKWHLFDNLFFMLLGYTYLFLKLII
jgi:hypothetical protein